VGERVLIRCGVAADLIHKGQYEAAREALSELWPGMGGRPDVKNLPPAVAAEVLLQCGALTGLLGGARNVSGAQERAKDILTEALRAFQSLGNYRKASAAQCELGACYWRLGAHDDARAMMREALKPLNELDIELKAGILIRLTLAEVWENKYHEALSILKEAEPVFESANDALKGRWHGQRGIILLKLFMAEGRADYADRAIIEFTAAICQAGGTMSTPKPRTNTPQFLTVEEIAEMLRLKPRTIYNMVSQRRIPFRKAGRQLLFDVGEIEEWT
jgi:excisionase family DNA binding protein